MILILISINPYCSRFEIDIEAKESRSSHRAKATVNLWVFEPAQQIKMIINKDPMMVNIEKERQPQTKLRFHSNFGFGV